MEEIQLYKAIRATTNVSPPVRFKSFNDPELHGTARDQWSSGQGQSKYVLTVCGEQPPASYTSIEQFEAQVIAQHIDLDDVVAVSFWPPASISLQSNSSAVFPCGVLINNNLLPWLDA
ncbi:hypothetical protein GX48_03692 [Paracoccidioides brasiliensis]|nr:hypothetical protein GX48_03692 [Paracoccidioides brasiliensis]